MVTVKDAEDFKEQMSKPDLVFLTPENKDRIEAEAQALTEAEKGNASN